MNAKKLAQHVYDQFLEGFHHFSWVTGVLFRQNHEAVDIVVLSNDEKVTSHTFIINYWMGLETLLEAVNEALPDQNVIPRASSIEVRTTKNTASTSFDNTYIGMKLANECLEELRKAGKYPLDHLPWTIVQKPNR